MTKFKRITTVIDDWELKSDYLNFIKNQLYHQAEAQGASAELLAEAEEAVDDVNFSEFSVRLGYPKFSQATDDPLLILADLPLPIDPTTGYHNFIEEALKKAGKTPRSEIRPLARRSGRSSPRCLIPLRCWNHKKIPTHSARAVGLSFAWI